jgi:hypothetical protein
VDVPPDEWWDASTAAIALLGQVEARAVDATIDESGALAHAQRLRTLWLTGLILTVLVITLGAWVLIGRSMVRSLRDLRAQALEVATRRLPEALERLRAAERQADIDNLPTTAFPQLGGDNSRRDEIGEVGDAFAAVHASAVRLAGEQAGAASRANSMIVNVARRSQMLVERQLKLLDEVQSAEDDPDQLANLFRLDHLLTRMRRNDENLLVLAGADTSRPPARPGAAVRGGAGSDGRDRGVRTGRLRRRRRRLHRRRRRCRRRAHPGRAAGERRVVLAAGLDGPRHRPGGARRPVGHRPRRRPRARDDREEAGRGERAAGRYRFARPAPANRRRRQLPSRRRRHRWGCGWSAGWPPGTA